MKVHSGQLKKNTDEDMTHVNELIEQHLSTFKEQYRADLWKYKERESLNIKTENKLDTGTKTNCRLKCLVRYEN